MVRGLASTTTVQSPGTVRACREDELLHVVALRFERAAETPDAVPRHLDDLRRRIAVAVVGRVLEVRMEFEIVHRQLAVAFDEADRDLALAQHALDAERDFGLVGALHQHAAPFRLDHRGVVDLDAAGAGEGRLLVGIDRPELEVRIAPFHDLEDVAGALRGRVARVVEVGDRDVAVEQVDHAQGGGRRRVDFLARQVDVAVVQVERHVGEQRKPPTATTTMPAI